MFSNGSPISRRALLQRLGSGLGMAGLAGLLADGKLLAADAPAPLQGPLAPKPTHFKPTAKRVIQFIMDGGPSHLDTFDPKPALAKYDGQQPPAAVAQRIFGTLGRNRLLMKSPFKFRKQGTSGIEVSEIYPELGTCIDDICVVRSMCTDTGNHLPAQLLMACGEMTATRPTVGSWLVYGLGAVNQNLPGFMVLRPDNSTANSQLCGSGFLPSICQGAQIASGRSDPKAMLPNLNNTYLPKNAQRDQLDLMQRLNDLHLQQRGGKEDPLEARIQSMEMAFRMQFEAQDMFDLTRESKATRDLYGAGAFANSCLMARRLVERGVRVVQVYSDYGWDDHLNIQDHAKSARASDRPMAALLKDLKGRGMLDDTLVVWGGEFGRTPTSENFRGRDHSHLGFSMWLAGGGVRGGSVYGATDELGFAAVENKMHVHDLHATVLHLMGLDHEKLTYRHSGRDYRLTEVAGSVAKGVLA